MAMYSYRRNSGDEISERADRCRRPGDHDLRARGMYVVYFTAPVEGWIGHIRTPGDGAQPACESSARWGRLRPDLSRLWRADRHDGGGLRATPASRYSQPW